MAARRPSTIVCDVDSLAADARSIDALARFGLAARRLGMTITIRHASVELEQLLRFVGLDRVLGLQPSRDGDDERTGM